MTTTDKPTTVEQIYALPEAIQDQLLRIAHLAIGMSAEEKITSRMLIAGLSHGFVSDPDFASDSDLDAPDVMATVEMLGACGMVVVAVDGLSGSSASGLVV